MAGKGGNGKRCRRNCQGGKCVIQSINHKQVKYAGMMKLVDMRDLGSRAAMRWGSSPHARTKRAVLGLLVFYMIEAAEPEPMAGFGSEKNSPQQSDGARWCFFSREASYAQEVKKGAAAPPGAAAVSVFVRIDEIKSEQKHYFFFLPSRTARAPAEVANMPLSIPRLVTSPVLGFTGLLGSTG